MTDTTRSNTATTSAESASERNNQSQKQNYGRAGPYPKDTELFDPLNGEPPNDWSIKCHLIGGDHEITNSQRERAVWVHHEHGTLAVCGQEGDAATQPLVFHLECSDRVKDALEQEHRNLDREEAYDIAVELMEQL